MTDRLESAREAMVRQIMREMAAAGLPRAEISETVLQAMRAVPRHRFVPAGQIDAAYANSPLAIGHGQTISQPFIVALMTDLLDLGPADTVLEVGTGCGYQTAVASRLAARVYSVEIVAELSSEAALRLAELGCRNVATRVADGNDGWQAHAPYDKIIVTAAAREVPRALLAQLAAPGRMVVPLGAAHGPQTLTLIERSGRGADHCEPLLPVMFVPLVPVVDG